MADTKISQLTTLAAASVVSGDWIPIVDVSDTSMAATGTTKKLGATMALTNIANTFSAAQIFSAAVTVGAITTRTETIAQNTAVSFTPVSNLGMMIITPNFFPDVAGLIVYRAAASGFCSVLVGGGNLDATTGTLNGTTGSNGKVTVSTVSNGGVYIENRRASSIQFKLLVIG